MGAACTPGALLGAGNIAVNRRGEAPPSWSSHAGAGDGQRPSTACSLPALGIVENSSSSWERRVSRKAWVGSAVEAEGWKAGRGRGGREVGRGWWRLVGVRF